MVAWYENWFSSEYLELYSHRNQREAEQQINFLLGLTKLDQQDQVLDIACGAGRHLVEYAKHGLKAYGIDLAADLIKEAKKRVTTDSYEIEIKKADMRKLPYTEDFFDLVSSMFTSFGYFETDDEHLNLLVEWKRVLKPGGYLFIDYLNKEKTIASLIPQDKKELGGKKVTQNRFLSKNKRRINKKITIEDNGEIREYNESVRMYSKIEIEELLKSAGFLTNNFYGDFSGSSYNEDSDRLLILAHAN